MKRRKLNFIIMISIVLLALLLGACGRQTNDENADQSEDTVITQVVLTAWAAGTETAIANPATPTYTPTIAATNTALPTMQASPTPGTTTPTATIAVQQPPGGGTSSGCDQAEFVSDVTVPDGTRFSAGEDFTKTWELKNTGTCTWNASYQIVFYGGEQMGADATAALTGDEVAPGETVQVSIDMTAPDTNGDYYSYWILRNASGQNFFINGSSIYAQITVGTSPTKTPTATGQPTATATATPTASVSISASANTGGTSTKFTFTATAKDLDGTDISDNVTWTWAHETDGNDAGTMGTGATIADFQFSQTGVYTVKATVQLSDATPKSASIQITIN